MYVHGFNAFSRVGWRQDRPGAFVREHYHEGVRTIQRTWLCQDCGKVSPTKFTLVPELWNRLFHRGGIACIRCASIRNGRAFKPGEFLPTARNIPHRERAERAIAASLVVGRLLDDFGQDPADINRGMCDEFAENLVDWAKRAAGLYGEPIWLNTLPDGDAYAHMAVYFKSLDLWFDAQTPRGVTIWQQLDYVKDRTS
jgi:hypothetical protein